MLYEMLTWNLRAELQVNILHPMDSGNPAIVNVKWIYILQAKLDSKIFHCEYLFSNVIWSHLKWLTQKWQMQWEKSQNVGTPLRCVVCKNTFYLFLWHIFPVLVSLQQVDENRKTVANEIKKSICNLIMEINRKGKLLVNQLEVVSSISSSREVLPNWLS